MTHYYALLVTGDLPITATLEAFHHADELALGPDYDFRFDRFPHKAQTWQAYASIEGEPPPQWCAGCGGGRPRSRYQPVTIRYGNPYCPRCIERDTEHMANVRPDGNVMNRHRDPAAWDEWVRISDSWGYP